MTTTEIAPPHGADRLTPAARAALASAGVPAAVHPLVRALAVEPARLAAAWRACRDAADDLDAGLFAEAVSALAGRACEPCSDCGAPAWAEDGERDFAGDFLCEGCAATRTRCDGCDELRPDGDVTWVGGSAYCDPCRDDRCSFCDDCGEWYHDEDSSEHVHHQCGCEAPHPEFRFPAGGRDSVRQDERLAVEVAAGVIDPEGIAEVVSRVWSEVSAGLLGARYDDVENAVTALEPRWQTTRGNFTRRLGAALYERHGVKLGPAALSDVGSIARRHSSESALWLVEFTRDLNLPPEAFYNDGSCWWSSHAASRCALKSWGGLAMRSYRSADDPDDCPSGRAWVQPLTDGLRPTHDAAGAHAYLVYNCYGDLDGFAAARLVAHLADRSYRRVRCFLGDQFVNGDSGYLVADPATCERTDRVEVPHGFHERFDAGRHALGAAA